MIYQGLFYNWNDVQKNFCISIEEQDLIPLVAAYDTDGYNGSALVIYWQEGQLYLVQGSHSSYYGLEDQWEPEETSVELLFHMIKNGRLHCDTTYLEKALPCFLED